VITAQSQNEITVRWRKR